ncbi:MULTISPECIES: hypothetical protein [unclassified Sphingomonas]|uniref:hypothetical protein n=1 Tax=unclassified Sphingomonas TaxID=196159 RepID=UPI0022B43CF7|nr:hypothetical protein [Sphingomonas sp. NIBR02145]WHU00748.1 hypothetical protein O3305_10990 [Sphingomonas sp. NIBR02145]
MHVDGIDDLTVEPVLLGHRDPPLWRQMTDPWIRKAAAKYLQLSNGFSSFERLEASFIKLRCRNYSTEVDLQAGLYN